MTSLAQVAHVMKKDLREVRWLLLAYVATVAVSTAHAAAGSATSLNALDGSMIFVVILGMFVVAAIVQADSPTRSDAFWASRPLRSTSVLAAKLAFTLLVVLVVGLVGQLVALVSLAAPVAALPLLLFRSACAYAMWLLITIVVAALSRDLRTVVVAFVCGAVVLSLALSILRLNLEITESQAYGLSALGAAGAIALLSQLYAVRHAQKGIWFAAFVFAAGMFFSLMYQTRETVPNAPDVPSPERLKFDVSIVDPSELTTSDVLQLRLRVTGIKPGETVSFAPGRAGVVLQFRNRANDTLSLADRPGAPGTVPMPWEAGEKWLGTRIDNSSAVVTLGVRLTAKQRNDARSGVTAVQVDGWLDLVEEQLITTLPLYKGASAAYEGVRIRVEEVDSLLDGGSLRVRTSYVQSGGEGFRRVRNAAQFGDGFALVNESTGERLALHAWGRSGSAAMLVLPGVNSSDQVLSLRANPTIAHARELVLPDAWRLDAKLVLLDRVAVGHVAVHTTIMVP